MTIDASLFFDLLLITLHRNDEKVKILASELFELFEKNVQFISDTDAKYITFYISIIKEVLTNKLNIEKNVNTIRSIIHKYLTSKLFKNDKKFKDLVMSGIEEKVNVSRLTKLSERLNNFVIWHKSNKFVRSLYGNLKECSIAFDIEEQSKQLNQMQNLLTDFQKSLLEMNTTIGSGSAIEKIDFTNKDDIVRSFNTYKERKVTHILRTGIQGLNRMFGPRNGIALGESVIFCALPHNYKSMMLLSIANWLVKYSNPPKEDGMKNMILFISLENEAYENMMLLFEQLYVITTGKKPSEMKDDEIIDYIYNYFSKAGYVLVIERYLPATFGFDELVALYEKYENSGYRIVATIIDYLSKMKKGTGNYNSSSVGNHLMIQELYNNVCNYTKAKGSCMLSAHQLNRKAAELVSSGVPNPVKRFNENFLADSMDVAREPDVIVYMHIERNDAGEPFLTLQWAKHRYVHNTPEVDKYCAYRLTDVGIVDDINNKPTFVRNIHKTKNSSGDISEEDIDTLVGL